MFGCKVYDYGIMNLALPCTNLGIMTPFESNNTRTRCTFFRWIIETRFGNFGNIWKIFQTSTTMLNCNYIKLFGIWLNTAGAICNHLNIAWLSQYR